MLALGASVMLAPSGLSPAHLSRLDLGTLVDRKLLKSLNSTFGRALSCQAELLLLRRRRSDLKERHRSYIDGKGLIAVLVMLLPRM